MAMTQKGHLDSALPERPLKLTPASYLLWHKFFGSLSFIRK